MSVSQIQAGLRRFAKGFLAGGLAQVALIINAGVTIRNLADIKAVLAVLVAGFITGGILAVQKMLSWEETLPTNVPPIDSLPQ